MSYVWSWLNAAYDWLIGAAGAAFLLFVGDWLICWLEKAICAIFGFMLALIMPYMIYALASLPSMPWLNVHVIRNLWRTVNYWTPLNETLTAITTALTLVALFRGFRFIKQFVPSASN